ncbi:MAG TPA: hypothetical protein PKO41_03270 [Dokdonella sp.]|uniref:hypothetical protein n=1 Tax=Dokdonella sp. TaxID=2291710 RepID=UPI0025C6F1E3|nr:hypothetical protein [Dokdonella sp.]MBX3690644.1 hypothetical protein [Dokdonella sp.]MCW5568084.1 hypothetical protein [Dokdonella sp.]HNR91426.1 hypothetical protein [Dokdonella sp.]
MKPHLIGALCAVLGSLAACSDRAAEKPRADEAIARSEPTSAPAEAAAPADPSAGHCAQVGGNWNEASGQCQVNAAMCASTGAGTWSEGVGCVTAGIASEADCVGFGGMRWDGSQCVLAFLDRNDLKNIGL